MRTEINVLLSNSEITAAQVLGQVPDGKEIRLKKGCCDICGLWDSALIEGLCHVCDLKYGARR